MLGYAYGKRFGSKLAWASRKESDKVMVDPVAEQVAYKDGTECSETSGI
jgi:hypothetical protein